MNPSLHDEQIAALRLEVAALRFERDFLLAQRDATREWLGEHIKGTPLNPDQSLTLTEYARSLVKSAPRGPGHNPKIAAIKMLREYSMTVPSRTALGLKEAKDMIEAAFEGRL